MANETISVILPAYQKGERIRACLRSVCAQTYADLEIIVVYLRSADETWNEILSINDSRLKIVEQKEKTGPGGARALGLESATGAYIGFVDCDDSVPPDYFESLLRALKDNNADIAMGETILENGANRTYRVKHRRERVLTTFEEKYGLLTNGAVFDKLFKTSLLRRQNISFPSGVFWEDNPFLLQAFWAEGKLALTSKAIYRYTRSPRDNTRNTRLMADIPIVAAQMLDFAAKANFPPLARTLVKRKILEAFVGRFVFHASLRKQLIPLFGGGWPFTLAFVISAFNILAHRLAMRFASITL